ncbi:NAD dependent epimerase/dehydratase family protein [Pseudarthrobacter equi]|uniref:NAD dependent epimerase/dehydratase family protein n=1 Tax=Pseudarthrobacter equi TaxID=728066 RepID=A0A1H1ZKG9_9MICC|nr:NAD(P)-dependent oxidoreductase [Pseudarthrobacter equi]SDT34153.1 NAD dependent epimerase/dehydratase family protein [Pseudarthrobacter equi]
MPAAPKPQIIALTGGAGMMATLLRPYLVEAGHTVRLLDLAEAADPAPSETVYVGSVADPDFMRAALAGVSAVIHLGGLHREKEWAELVATNITGTQVTLEAARLNGVERVLLASSTHAVGFHPTADAANDTVLIPRPDTYYGVSKAAVEALGSLYADKYGMKVVSARIGTGGDRPGNLRTLGSWLSPADSYRLVEATLNDRGAPGHHVVWAVSANTRGWASLAAGRAIGFEPRDDAEAFAGEVDAAAGDTWAGLLGGFWATDGHKVGMDNYPHLAAK